MAAIDFPSNPTTYQTYSAGGKTWRWDGTSWGLVASGTVIIPASMVQIGQVVCSGSQATVTFSNIPQNYNDLKIVVVGRCTNTAVGDASFSVKFNSDSTAANYSNGQWIYGQGTGTAPQGTAGPSTSGTLCGKLPGILSNSNAIGSNEVTLLNYNSSLFFKTVMGYTAMFQQATPTIMNLHWHSQWKSTAPITSVTLTPDYPFVDGSVVTLYGIGGSNIVVASTGGTDRIAQVVCSGNQSTVTFANIPQNYTNLRVTMLARDTSSSINGGALYCKLNGDSTAGNYTTREYLEANSTNSAAAGAIAADATKGQGISGLPGTLGNASALATSTIDFIGYTSTIFQKNVMCQCFGNSNVTDLIYYGFTWKSTAAINNIIFTAGGTAFADGSIFTLYGVP